MADLPAANVRRLVLAAAGDVRISQEAVTGAVAATVDFLRRLGTQAGSIARGHGRKTIMIEDLDAAQRQLLGPPGPP